ncbi:bone morphogenetic protein 1-like isoform X2 [Watersipora subatra]
MILEGIEHWQNNTCITFREASEYDKDFVFFTPKSCGCCSLVGRNGGRQELSLQEDCATTAVAMHELGHLLGFWHEQARPDRDSAIKVLWKNIRPEHHDNYAKRKYVEVESFGRPYDLSSIMHYGVGTFSNGNGPTMVSKNGEKIGKQASNLSSEDILQANLLYSCPAKECKTELEGSSGEIISPYYPNNYIPDIDCQWTIHVPKSKYIQLTFNEMNLQDSYLCSADSLVVRELSQSGRIVCTLCGSALPPRIVSTVSLWIRLHSNWAIEKRGFNISYEIRDIMPVDMLGLSRHPKEAVWKTSDCVQVSRAHHGVYHSADIPSNGQFTSDGVCSFIIDGSTSAGAQRILLELVTSQIRAYGRDCLAHIYVPTSNSTYFGNFESAKDEITLDPLLWRPVHYSCGGSEKVVEIVVEKLVVVVIWSSAHHRALNLTYWIDVNECQISPRCDHICEDTIKGYRCSCHDGFQLINNHTCVRKVQEITGRCHQQMTAPMGKIISSTEPHSLCSYDILRPGHKITLVINRLYFPHEGQCSINSLNITSNKHLLAHLCSSSARLELTAGESITLLQSFNSSLGNRLPFFIASYSSSKKQPEACEFILQGDSEVMSPSYPNLYNSHINCIWKLSVKKESRINLTIVDLDIEYTDNCIFDSLTIFDGRNRKYPVLLKACDTSKTTITSTSNQLTVEFITDGSGAGRGFRLISKEIRSNDL